MYSNATVELFGIDTPHMTDFVVHRPTGLGMYVIMCFSTPFQILTVNGMEYGRPGDIILHSPTFTQYHTSVNGAETGFVNDWAHIESDYITDFAKRILLPFDTLISSNEPDFLKIYLLQISNELNLKRFLYQDKINAIIQNMLIDIARINNENAFCCDISEARRNKFIELRKHISENLSKHFYTKELADMTELSPSRFNIVYRRLFGVSPNEDILLMRLDYAKKLLLSTYDSIEHISAVSGFDDPYYFSKIFKTKIGVSPSKYRNRV